MQRHVRARGFPLFRFASMEGPWRGTARSEMEFEIAARGARDDDARRARATRRRH
jgi:hypothetical protein